MNCVAVHITFNYTFIKMWHKIPEHVHIEPSLRDIMSRSEIAILGDDKTQIVSDDIPMSEEDLIQIAKELGMECTSSKGDAHSDNEIDFCSRVFFWSEKDQIVYPKLKKESIVGLLYWFASFDRNQVRDNMMIALFESSIHNQDFFESILRDVLILAKNMNIDPRTIPFTNFEQARRRLRSMIMNDIEYQQISALANRETNLLYDNERISFLLKQSSIAENNKILRVENQRAVTPTTYESIKPEAQHKYTPVLTDESAMERYTSSNDNPISRCHELLSKLEKQSPSEHFDRSGPAHSPVYTCTLNFEGREFGGEGPSKVSAKTQAYGALAVFLKDHIIPNAVDKEQVIIAEVTIQKISQRAFSLYIEKHIKTAKKCSDGKRYVKLLSSGYTRRHLENHDGFDCFYNDGHRYVLSDIISKLNKEDTAACYMRYPGITWNDVTREITLDVNENTSKWSLRNIDVKDYTDDEHLTTTATPETIIPNSTEEKPMLGVINNDDPVKMPETGVMLSDKEMYHPLIMNRSAPSNSWLQAGGITFNISDLIYNQFVFANEQIKIGNQARGKIIAQIPYTVVNNKYVNDYIQNYALLHNRMTGDWMIKFSCPGSFGLQCSVLVAWYPRKMKEDTIADMSELSKYAFFTNSLSVPWSQTIVVTDARQNQFYREIPHVSGQVNFDDQPHIVLAIETPNTPSFKDEVPAYITFASKLCSEKDLMFNPSIKPFVFADPCKAIAQDAERGYKLNF
uniref:RNA-dependent RNA polymerase n=1 Tax=Grapevine-associated RNA virus 1 TaxID=2814384 RepID=A0A8F5RB79_9VIRU|nr:MAG: RNA-dependent RNA polymerase [Grapevine-associated RNA virus 1]